MCGIAGAFEYGRSMGSLTDDLLGRMGGALEHRGPDGEGVHLTRDRRLGLAHRRLSIIDPEGGKQPMFGPNGTCIVFNGEIYNFPALRKRLTRHGAIFDTNCDTEVILHLYQKYGDACVDHLTGMFAFALWDEKRQRLFFARDPVGEKPFYWTVRQGTFVFASEIKSILEHPGVPRDVNRDAIGAYLTHLATPAPDTLYQGIFKLPAGHIGVCDRGGVQISEYRSFAQPRTWRNDSLEQATERVRALLTESVRARLMSDVPVGVLLSGGMDSTTILALASEHESRIDSFTVGFPGHASFDERAEARWVAQYYGTTHHEIEMTEQDALAALPGLVYHQDEPLADATCLPHALVCRLARDQGIKVLLAGEGADELFWGYDGYRRTLERWRRLSALMALPRPVRQAAALLTSPDRRPYRRERLDGIAAGRLNPAHMPLGLTRGQRRRMLGESVSDDRWSPSGRMGEDRLTTFCFDTQEYEFDVRLPELLLMRGDRFSMASSVESRVPFLDPDLVDYAYRLPPDFKIRSSITKYVLKRAVAEHVPDRVVRRQKQGFTPPVSQWLGSSYGQILEDLLRQDTLRAYFDTEHLHRAVTSMDPGSWEAGHLLWPILNFGLWHKHWIEGVDVASLDQIAGASVF